MATFESVHDAHDHTGIPGVGGGGLDSGTSFPVSPADRDLFYRTDRDLLYFYDDANTQWLTVAEYPLVWITRNALSNTGLSATTTVAHAATIGSDGNMWLSTFRIMAFIQTTAADASNTWQVALHSRDAANGNTAVTSILINSQTANTYKEWVGSADIEIDCSTEFQFLLVATETNSPGALYFGTDIRYRLIG